MWLCAVALAYGKHRWRTLGFGSMVYTWYLASWASLVGVRIPSLESWLEPRRDRHVRASPQLEARWFACLVGLGVVGMGRERLRPPWAVNACELETQMLRVAAVLIDGFCSRHGRLTRARSCPLRPGAHNDHPPLP